LFLPLIAVSCIGPHYYYVKKNGERGVYHRIEPGQTVWRIATAYGVDVAAVAAVNGLNDTFSITSGSYLFIPGVELRLSVPPAPATVPEPKGNEQKPSDEMQAKKPEQVFAWPVEGSITSTFGMRGTRRHEGVDISARRESDIRAAAGGVVKLSGWGPEDYGKTVVIVHEGGYETWYAHNASVLVAEGNTVMPGQLIARMGRTGNARGTHLHFEIRKNGSPVDPLQYLPERGVDERAGEVSR
jgi:murein DD-endopeptidase MepM/ murein hydrolase activator NlpD